MIDIDNKLERDTTLERQVKILETIASAPDGLYLSEISDKLSLAPPTVFRLVNILVKVGLLVPRGNRRKAYILGPRLGKIMHMNFAESTLARIVSPLLEDLVGIFDETSYACRLVGHQVYAINWRVPAHDERRGHYYPGHRMLPHAAASAKAILAFQSPALIEKALEEPLEAFTAHTKTDRHLILQEYENVRNQGYAVCAEELNNGMMAYACPVFSGESRQVFYSIAITASTNRLVDRKIPEIIANLKKTAAEFSRRLGSGEFR